LRQTTRRTTMNIFGFKRTNRVCLSRDFFAFALLAFLLLAGPAIGQQGYQRYGRVYINTHGSAVPASLVQYIAREGELLITKYRAIGITVPKGFHYKIDFLPNFEAYRKYSVANGSTVGPGTLGYTRIRVRVNQQDDRRMEPQVPTPIVCYWNHELPWEIVPTLLHEMCHAVHAANYGVMPLWLSEGLPEWYSNRKQHLGVQKKIATMRDYQRYMDLVQKMSAEQFVDFIASTKYDDWEKVIGDVGVGYFLAQTLVDFFLGNPSAQPYFRGALLQAKADSEWQFERSINWAKNVQTNWPQGIPMLLKGWKSWYKIQAQPKKTNGLDPFVDANREQFHRLLMAMRSKQAVTDADRYALVSQWLAFTRLEMDDLAKKRAESYHTGETALLRARLLQVQQFAAKDHTAREGITQAHRAGLIRARPNGADPLYRKTVPYQPMSWYLGINPTLGAHARPPYLSSTRLAPANFQWQGLDAWQANMIFTNLFTSFIDQPLPWPKPQLKAAAQGPFTVALRTNGMDADAALNSAGGKLERHPLTGEVITVNLSHARITNADLEHMAVLFQPHVLNLSDTEITDSAARHLAGWASLRVLKIGRTRLSRKAVEQLKYYSPGLVIQ